MPELGTAMWCVSCGEGPFLDLRRHQVYACQDYNAHLRLYNGYIRQHANGTAPPNVGPAPFRLLGQIYRMMRDFFGITPAVVMAQDTAWGPYDPIKPLPHTIGAPYDNISYDNCRLVLLNNFPPAVVQEPRPDHRMLALQRYLADRRCRYQYAEYNLADEKVDLIAIANFMDANPAFKTFAENHPNFQCPRWQDTIIHQTKHGIPPPPPGLFPPIPKWFNLNGFGQGIANQGHPPNGATGSILAHRQNFPQHPLYSGTSTSETSTGVFNTPTRRR